MNTGIKVDTCLVPKQSLEFFFSLLMTNDFNPLCVKPLWTNIN